MVDRLEGYQPEVGLENIGSYAEQRMRMPSQSDAQLTGEPIPTQLDVLFPGNSIEHVMRDFVSPQIPDPSILSPVRFDSLIRETTTELRAQAEQSGSETLHAATDVLEEHQDLRDLLHKNRAALLPI